MLQTGSKEISKVLYVLLKRYIIIKALYYY